MASTGKSSGAGSPPAKERMSGRSATFRISRTAEVFIRDMRRASCTSRLSTAPMSNLRVLVLLHVHVQRLLRGAEHDGGVRPGHARDGAHLVTEQVVQRARVGAL